MRGPRCMVLLILTAGVTFVQSSVPIAGGINYNQYPSQPIAAAQAYAHAQVPVGYAQAQASYSRFQAPYVQPRQNAFAYSQSLAYARPQASVRPGYYSQAFSAMPAACPASCPQSCYPQCTRSCCSPPPPPPPPPHPHPPPPPPPPPPPSCPAGCPKWCIPKCNVECCNPKPPPMPEYLKRQQLTATACEGKKLRIKCPNRSDKIIMYSTFYGRDDKNTCHHDVLPTSGYCNEQQHRVNEKVFNLCGHERRCIVAVNDKFFAADNTTICPDVYKYLKVIYKCSQHPKIFPICPLPCQTPKKCFPKCASDCCSPQPPKPKVVSTPKAPTAPPAPPAPPPPRPGAVSCPALCPSYCKPPCTADCCYGPPKPRQPLQRQQYGVLSSYFLPQRQRQRPSYLNMYGTLARASQYRQPQTRYFSRQYLSNPRLFSNYKRYPMSPTGCPAACRSTCAPGCPRHCCPVSPRRPYYRFMTKMGKQGPLWD